MRNHCFDERDETSDPKWRGRTQGVGGFVGCWGDLVVVSGFDHVSAANIGVAGEQHELTEDGVGFRPFGAVPDEPVVVDPTNRDGHDPTIL